MNLVKRDIVRLLKEPNYVQLIDLFYDKQPKQNKDETILRQIFELRNKLLWFQKGEYVGLTENEIKRFLWLLEEGYKNEVQPLRGIDYHTIQRIRLNYKYYIDGYLTLQDIEGIQEEHGIRFINYSIPQHEIKIFSDDNGETIYNELFTSKSFGEYNIKGLRNVIKDYKEKTIKDESTTIISEEEDETELYEYNFYRGIEDNYDYKLIRYTVSFRDTFYNYLKAVINEIFLGMLIPYDHNQKKKYDFMTAIIPNVVMILTGKLRDEAIQVIRIVTVDLEKGEEIMKTIEKYARPSNNLNTLKEYFRESYKEVDYYSAERRVGERLENHQLYMDMAKKLKGISDKRLVKTALKAAQQELEEQEKAVPVYDLYKQIFE